MKKCSAVLLLALMCLSSTALQAQKKLWSILRSDQVQLEGGIEQINPDQFTSYQLDLEQLNIILDQAPLRFSEAADLSQVIIELPSPDGSLKRFKIVEAPVFSSELAAKYPEMSSFAGYGIDDPYAYARFSIGPKGFHAMILSPNHSSIFIDPFHTNTTSTYKVYYKKDFHAHGKEMTCDFDHFNKEKIKETTPDIDKLPVNGDCQFRDYRMALACTGEYAQFHGGTVPLVLAAMNTSMTRVNGIFENEISVTMTLVPNNDLLIFLNAGSDPYTNNNGGAMLGQNITTCNNIIGSANYDIGHVFSTGGGGVAYLQSVCGSNKAGGVTGQSTPVGDPFDVDYVCHEIGHQFGGRHTQNNSCNRDSNSCYEPGSASTIMGYAGICAPNVQTNSDDYFHINSVILMNNFITGSGNCSVNTNTGNSNPDADAGLDYTIPKSTPFILEGSSTDPEGDAVTYCWEQYDKQVATMPPSSSSTSGPAFRSLDPTTSPDRYMPSLDNVVDNTNDTWEVLASVGRTYNFRLTARDNNPSGGCTDDDNMVVTVSGSQGPFLVTSPNTNVSWPGNSSQTVTWDVANTTTAPVSCATVDIFLSYDGGYTYPTTLASNVTNDGSHQITLPGTQSTTARIMVRGHNNIFYDISDNDFTISAPIGGFVIAATPASVSVCSGSTATYTIQTSPIAGFNTPITMSASGLPAGLNSTFSPNPVTPGSNTTLNVTNTGAAPAGTYNFTVTGTAGGNTFDITLELIVEAGVLAPGLPDIPANGATDIDLLPTLNWQAVTGAIDYDIQVASDPVFNNIIESETGIVGLSYTMTVQLSPFSTYYWRVKGTNNCTGGSYGPTFSFTTGNTLCSSFVSSDIPVTIPTTIATVSSEVILSNTGTLTDVNVKGIDITHSWINDLVVSITSPAGTSVTLFDQLCNNQDDALISFDDESQNTHGSIPCPPVDGLTYQPDGTLSDFDTENGDGTWTLIVEDVANQDGGSINAWEVEVCYELLLPLSASIQGFDVSCFGGSDGTALVIPAGGTGNYTYTWSDGQTGSSATNLSAGSYTCVIADGNSSITLSVTISQPTEINVTGTVTDVSTGSDGAIDILVNGGTPTYSYLWSNGATTQDITGLDAGVYTVTITDDNDCIDIEVYEVLNPPAPVVVIQSDVTNGCGPLTVQFTDQSSNNPTTWDWTFTGGTPANSNQQNPSVTYDTPGLYSVTLTASNPGGSDTQTFTDYIEVFPVAIPAFTSTQSGLDVTFNNQSQNADSYLWDFGDGNSSTEANPVHTYSNSGTYTVILSVTNNCGTETLTQTITLLVPPVAGFTAIPNQGCEPLVVQFVSTSSGQVDDYLWTFEGGTPSTSSAASPTVTFENPGLFDVTLEVSNAAGANEITQTDIIEVLPLPVAGFTAVESGLDVVFTNSSTDATSYTWDFGDGNNSTATNPSHSYNQSGTYTVVLTAFNGCGAESFTQNITVLIPPVAGFTVDINQGCAPLTVQFFSAATGQVDNYNWTFAGGVPASSTEMNPIVVFENPGLYTATLEVSNAAGSDIITQIDVVEVLPDPTASFSSVITNLDVDFTNLSTNASSYDWDFGDGNVSTETSPSHTYNQSGNYTVTLTATNSCGSVTFTQDVSILIAPIAGFTVDINQGCAPLTVQFTSTTIGSVDNYNWTFTGGTPATSTEANPIVIFENPGLYSATLEVTNASGTDVLTQTDLIEVFAQPSVDFEAVIDGLQVTLTNLSSNADTYNWDFGDGNTSSEVNPVHTYTESGNYSITLTASNDCGDTVYESTYSVIIAPSAGFIFTPNQGCAPLTVQFTSTSTGLIDDYLWTFEGGSPATSTEENPVVIYENAGIFSATLEVSNAAGTDDLVQTQIIEVFTLPTPSFEIELDDLNITISNSTQNANSYFWEFGDGETSTAFEPTHTYAEAGNYTVSLTVENDCGSVTINQNISISTAPIAGFDFTPNQGCAPLNVQFTNTALGQVDSYSWTFEGGTPATSTEANPTVIYNDAGIFDVSLEVSNAAGSDLIALQDQIEVFPSVQPAAFDYAINGNTVNFTNNNLNAQDFLWDFGDAQTSTEENPTHTYLSPGVYTVTLIASNDCNTVLIESIITVGFELPTAAFEVSSTDNCAPATMFFTDQSTGIPSTWLWTFEGGTPATSTEQNPSVEYTEAGTYSVILQVSNAAGSSTLNAQDYITIQAIPSTAFDYVNTSPNEYQFNNLTDDADTYEWDFGDGNGSQAIAPLHIYADAGTYTVTLTATNDCGSNTYTETIVISSVEKEQSIEPFSLYPNPNTGSFIIQWGDQSLDILHMTYLNTLGQIIPASFLQGEQEISVQVDDVPSGIYFIRLNTSKGDYVKKVIIQ